MPTIVATSALAEKPCVCSQVAAADAVAGRRSSKIFGSAKVVAWKMMLDTAVVRNTISDTRMNSALRSPAANAAAVAERATAPSATISSRRASA